MKVKELFDRPEKWTKDTYARNDRNVGVMPRDKQAVCWCLLGAVLHCYPKNADVVLGQIRRELGNRGYGLSLPKWNDDPDTTFTQVQNLVSDLDV